MNENEPWAGCEGILWPYELVHLRPRGRVDDKAAFSRFDVTVRAAFGHLSVAIQDQKRVRGLMTAEDTTLVGAMERKEGRGQRAGTYLFRELLVVSMKTCVIALVIAFLTPDVQVPSGRADGTWFFRQHDPVR